MSDMETGHIPRIRIRHRHSTGIRQFSCITGIENRRRAVKPLLYSVSIRPFFFITIFPRAPQNPNNCKQQTIIPKPPPLKVP